MEELTWFRGRRVSFSLRLPAGYEFDGSETFPMVTCLDDEDVMILFNGFQASEDFSDQVQCNLEPEEGEVSADRTIEVAGHPARLLRQVLRDEGEVHLVLVVAWGEAGEGLLIRAISPETAPDRERELEGLLLSLANLVPGSMPAPEGVASHRRPILAEDVAGACSDAGEAVQEGAGCSLAGHAFAISEETRFSYEDGRLSIEFRATSQGPAGKDLCGVLRDKEDASFGVRLHDLAFPTSRPEREMTFRDGSSPGGDSLRLDGVSYGVDFSGHLVLRGGWMHLRGRLGDSCGTQVPVAIHAPFPVQAVDPRHWRFRSVDEGLRAGAENVYCLDLQGQEVHGPETLRGFPNLEKLVLRHQGREIPAGLGPLETLRSLHLLGDYETGRQEPVVELPPDIFELPTLECLVIVGLPLASLPAEVGRLSTLRELSVTGCGLSHVPATLGSLLRLENLDLSGNRLEGLPDSVAELPGLQALDIRYNRLTSLPASLVRIRDVRLEHRHKRLYKDTSYVTEHDVAVAPELFMAAGNPTLRTALETGIEAQGLGAFVSAIMAEARWAVRFSLLGKGQGKAVGTTRFGGVPDLPADFPYPMTEGRHWTFMAQIDLASISALQGYLPRCGLLSFFCEDTVHGIEYEYPLAGKVGVFHFVDRDLRRYRFPAGAEFVEEGLAGSGYSGRGARAMAVASLPFLYSDHERLTPEGRSLLEIEDQGLEEGYATLRSSLLGGDDDAFVVNGHVFTQHESPEEQSAEDRGGDHGEWMVLLSFCSEGKVGFMFGDAGTMTFCIHKKDLAAGDFGRVVATQETS